MGLLDIGAGAGEGLETLLARQLAEEKFAEQQRATQATEGYRNRALTETSALRRQTAADTAAERGATQIRNTVQMRPIGATVTPEEKTHEVAGGGIPEGNYRNVLPMVPSRQMGTVNRTTDAAPARIAWEGTATQQQARQAEQDTHADRIAGQETAAADRATAREQAKAYHDELNADRDAARADANTRHDNPPEPAAVRQQKRNAGKVRQHLGTIRQEADAIDQMGLMGPVGGRWADFMAGKIGSAQLGTNLTAQQAQALNKFRTDVGLLQSGMAMVHGGARGGGSAMITAKMEGLINANRMDKPGLNGALDSFDDWLKTYQEDPDKAVAGDFNPGGSGAGGGTAPAAAPNIKSIRIVKP